MAEPPAPAGGAARDERPRATTILMQEHGVIAGALLVLGAMLDRLADDEPVEPGDLARLLDFFRRFADAAHHAKEEEVLFPALESAGLARQGGPISVMREEHDRCRRLLLTLTEELPAIQGSSAARGRFIAAARAYTELLQHHIEKENTVLFQVAQRLLGPEEERRLGQAFARQIQAVMDPADPARLQRDVEALAAAWLR